MALVQGTMGPLSSSAGLGYASSGKVQLSVLESFTEIRQSKKCTLFKIVVKTPGNLGFGLRGQEWALSRRYTEFVRLNDTLKKAYPDINLKVPGKRFFNNFDPMFVEHRRQGLDNLVQQLAKDQRLMEHALTKEFLQMDRSSVDSGSPESPPSSRSSSGTESPVNLGPSEKSSVKPSDFDFLKVIGKGSFGKVLLARHKSEDKVYAVKVLQKAQIKKNNEVRHIMSERNILRKNIQHPFLVGLHYSFQTRDKLYFVLDYVNGGELFHHLQRERSFSEIRSRFYAAEIASALGYLHSKKIIYRDLKPENLLLDGEGHIRLTDFGLCKENIEALDGGTTNTFCGTPEYLAPEILRKQPYTAVVDWWGLGAVLFEMLYGLPPFYSRDTAEMYDAILHKPLRLRTNVSEPARDLLEKLLQKEPKMRLGYEGDFEKIAAHHYFRTIDWSMLLAKQLKPPYNPHVSGNYDLRHIDHEFTSEPVPKSLTDTTPFSGPSSMDNTFAGFSYVPSCDNSLGSCL